MDAAAFMLLAQTQGPSTFEMFLHAGLMAKFVLSLLVLLSMGSWAIMIGKWLQLRRARKATRKFLAVFRRSSRFSEVNKGAENLKASPIVGIFQSGYIEIDAQIKAQRSGDGGGGPAYQMKSLGGLDRSLRRAVTAEMQAMVAFESIGATGSTSLVSVAPGIAEALINTAAGLAAAIPALLGFNFFSTEIRGWRAELDDFVLEFLNLAERNFT